MGAKTNWYKGKKEVEPPATTNRDEESASPKEDLSQRKQSQKAGRKGKKRGPDRERLTLGGMKRLEKAEKEGNNSKPQMSHVKKTIILN